MSFSSSGAVGREKTSAMVESFDTATGVTLAIPKIPFGCCSFMTGTLLRELPALDLNSNDIYIEFSPSLAGLGLLKAFQPVRIGHLEWQVLQLVT
jgi:hypothetical protein